MHTQTTDSATATPLFSQADRTSRRGRPPRASTVSRAGPAPAGAAAQRFVPVDPGVDEMRRVLLLICILVLVALAATGVTLAALYATAMQQQRERVTEIAQSQARLIEAVARFDRGHAAGYDEAPGEATLRQIRDARRGFAGFGQSGELVLARREGDSAVFLLSHRHGGEEEGPQRVRLDSGLAEPMRLALSGRSTTLIGPDYRGRTVLAATEPVAELDLGLVAKIDLAEIRSPFLHAGALALGVTLLLAAGGAALFYWLTNPLIARLRENEVRFRALFDHAPLGIALVDAQGRPVLANPALQRILGYEAWELREMPFSEFTHADDLEKDVKHYRALWKGERSTYAMEKRFVRKDGTELWGALTVSAIEGPKGGVLGAVAMVEDVTERKRAERARRHARDELERRVEARTAELSAANERLAELDRLKSLFIASMSHELRTPLNSIIGFTGLILMGRVGPMTAKQADYLRRVQESAKHLLDLITDVIDVSKIEAGKIEHVAESVRLDELCRAAVSHVETAARDKGIRLVERVPPLVLGTDRRRLLQCLSNYLSNAVKYSVRGEVEILAREEGEWVRVAVRDQGPGIAPEDLPRLFRQFSRIDSRATRTTLGTGLGLYLTRKLATEVLGGEVGVESEPGVGSTFWIRIPAGRAEPPHAWSPGAGWDRDHSPPPAVDR